MLSGLYNAAQAMTFAEKRHAVASENLANAHMPDFRRRILHQTEFGRFLNDKQQSAAQSAAAAAAAAATNGASNAATNGSGSPAGSTAAASANNNPNSNSMFGIVSDFSNGPVQQTGRPLDVSIEGEGFFVVEGPQGPLYTRNGGFHVDTAGRIVTTDNLPVQGTSGNLILPADASTESITISNDGQISAGATSVGQIRVVVAQNPLELTAMGETLYAATASSGIEDADVKLSQGMLEASNVTAVAELVNLIVASRQYEAAQKTLTAIDTAIRNRIDL